MKDLSHLGALLARLGRENNRLKAASSAWLITTGTRAKARIANEIAFRQREIAACEKEIAAEYKFLGIDPSVPAEIEAMSDDELLAELGR